MKGVCVCVGVCVGVGGGGGESIQCDWYKKGGVN